MSNNSNQFNGGNAPSNIQDIQRLLQLVQFAGIAPPPGIPPRPHQVHLSPPAALNGHAAANGVPRIAQGQFPAFGNAGFPQNQLQLNGVIPLPNLLENVQNRLALASGAPRPFVFLQATPQATQIQAPQQPSLMQGVPQNQLQLNGAIRLPHGFQNVPNHPAVSLGARNGYATPGNAVPALQHLLPYNLNGIPPGFGFQFQGFGPNPYASNPLAHQPGTSTAGFPRAVDQAGPSSALSGSSGQPGSSDSGPNGVQQDLDPQSSSILREFVDNNPGQFVKNMTDEIRRAREEAQKLKAEKTKVEEALETAIASRESAEGEFATATEAHNRAMDQLRTELSTAQQVAQASAREKTKLDEDLETAIASGITAEGEARTAKEKMAAETRRADEALKSRDAAEQRTQRLEQDSTKLRTEKANLEEALRKALDSQKTAEEGLATATEAHNQAMDQLRAELTTAEQVAQASARAVQVARASATTARYRIGLHARQHEAAQTQLHDANRRISAIESEAAERTERLSRDNTSLRTQLRTAQAEIARMLEELNEAGRRAQQDAQASARAIQVARASATKARYRADLRDRHLATIRRTNEDLSTSNRQLTLALQAAEDRVRDAEHHGSSTAAELTRELQAANRRTSVIQREAAERTARLSRENISLRNGQRTARAEIVRLTEELNEAGRRAQQNAETSARAVQVARASATEARCRADVCASYLERIQMTNEALSTNINTLSREQHEAQDQIARMTEELEREQRDAVGIAVARLINAIDSQPSQTDAPAPRRFHDEVNTVDRIAIQQILDADEQEEMELEQDPDQPGTSGPARYTNGRLIPPVNSEEPGPSRSKKSAMPIDQDRRFQIEDLDFGEEPAEYRDAGEFPEDVELHDVADQRTESELVRDPDVPDTNDIRLRIEHPSIKELIRKSNGTRNAGIYFWDPSRESVSDDGRPQAQLVRNPPPQLHLRRFAIERGEQMSKPEARALREAMIEEQQIEVKMGVLQVESRSEASARQAEEARGNEEREPEEQQDDVVEENCQVPENEFDEEDEDDVEDEDDEPMDGDEDEPHPTDIRIRMGHRKLVKLVRWTKGHKKLAKEEEMKEKNKREAATERPTSCLWDPIVGREGDDGLPELQIANNVPVPGRLRLVNNVSSKRGKRMTVRKSNKVYEELRVEQKFQEEGMKVIKVKSRRELEDEKKKQMKGKKRGSRKRKASQDEDSEKGPDEPPSTYPSFSAKRRRDDDDDGGAGSSAVPISLCPPVC